MTMPTTSAWQAVRAIRAAVLWTPAQCRYDEARPPVLTTGLNVLFALAATATVANLYYCQPVLYQIAATFGVSFEHASRVAALMQAGYASGIVLLCPAADVLPRRPFVLGLVLATALAWIGLCVTHSFAAFSALSFICGATTVTPQLMLPLVGDLAPPHRRASALAIVVSGLSLGMMAARVLAGVVATYASWRAVYWLGLAAQLAVLVALYAWMPDFPAKNASPTSASSSSTTTPTSKMHALAAYATTLYGGILVLVVRHPALVQACIVVFCLSAVFASFWTTLSFLLASPPYEYPAIAIGLFGLIGIVVVCLAPLYGRVVIQHIVPVVAVLIGTAIEAAGVAVGIAIGPFSVAGPVVQAVLVDFGNQASNIALRASIYGLAPHAQNRVNAAYMVASFTGQLAGTAAGNRLYALAGWRASGALSLALLAVAALACVVRGPRETGWVGWHGGWAVRRDPDAVDSEQTGQTDQTDKTDKTVNTVNTVNTAKTEAQKEPQNATSAPK